MRNMHRIAGVAFLSIAAWASGQEPSPATTALTEPSVTVPSLESIMLPQIPEAPVVVIAKEDGYVVAMLQMNAWAKNRLAAFHYRPSSLLIRTDLKTGETLVLSDTAPDSYDADSGRMNTIIGSPITQSGRGTFSIPPAASFGTFISAIVDGGTVYALQRRNTISFVGKFNSYEDDGTLVTATRLYLAAIPLQKAGEVRYVEVSAETSKNVYAPEKIFLPKEEPALTAKEGIIIVGDLGQFSFDGKKFTKKQAK